MGNQMVYLPEPITEKEVEDGGDFGECGSHYGVCGMQGWRRNMEDSHLALPKFDREVGLYGVFDGHGGRGVARYAAKRFPEILRETEAYKKEDYSKALEQAFLTIDERLREPAGRKEVAELDQPDPSEAPARPIEVPRSMLRRILQREAPEEAEGSSGGPGAGPTPAKKMAILAAGARSEEDGNSGAKAADAGDAGGAGELGRDGEAPETLTEKPSAPEAVAASSPESSAEGSAGGSIESSVKASTGGSAEASAEASAKDSAGGGGEPVRGQRYVEDEEEDDDEDEMVLIDPARLMKDASPEAQGCTAVVVLLVLREGGGEGRRLYCANAGDSRAIMSRLGRVVALSEDQKPENPGETARIEKAGGYVQYMPGGARVQGDLNLSRAMGDLRYKKPEHLPPAEQILTVFPEVHRFPLTDEDQFLVLGCDGIWERSTSQAMIDFVHGHLSSSPAGGSEEERPLSRICGEACDQGLCESMEAENADGTGCDNMTMMIVQLSRNVIQDRTSAKRPAEIVAGGTDGSATKAQKV